MPTPTAPRLRPLVPCALFAALAAALIATHYAVEQGSLAQALAYQAAGFAAFVAVVAGTLLHRPERRAHLWWLAAGLGLLSAGDAVWFAYDFVLRTERPYPSVADWVYLGGYGAILVAVLLLVRSRQRPGLADLLDGAIVLTGSALLFWFALIGPVARDTSATVVSRVVSGAYPSADVLLVVAVAQLVLTAGAKTFAFRALALGAVVLLATDIVYGLQTLQGTYVSGGWLDAGWMLMTTLWGIAVLHPSIRSLHTHAPVRHSRLTWRRLALLAATSLVTPFVVVYYFAGEDALDVGFVAGAATATTLLIFGRLALLFREHGAAVAALRDVEARKEAAQALRLSHERFQSAARALDCAIYEWTVADESVLWTDGLRSAFGYPLEAVEPTLTWWLDRVHPDDVAETERIVAEVHSGATTTEMHYRFRCRDGRYRHVWDRWVATRDADGLVLSIVGGMTDVTDRVELERELRQSHKMEAVGRLAGGIAHDFNNLLMAISGNAELLAGRTSLDDGARRDVAEIRRAADRAAELTRQLLTFSRAEAPQTEAVPLNELVVRTETMLRRLLGPGVEIETALEPDSGAVLCDAGQLEQVLVNLAVNARDAMPDGGRLRIATRREGPGEGPPELDGRACGVLSVVDTGIGIDSEVIGRIFEPFFTTKDVGKGTGLGLATVYGIVRNAGGTVVVSSERGRGTAFDVYLPWAAEGAPAEPVPEAPAAAGGTEEILLVEDEPAVRDIVATMLERKGYSVIQAEGPLEALALLEGGECSPDLVVTDLLMPKLNGWQLAGRVLELRPRTSFIFISGFTGASDPADGELDCEWRFVQKPFAAGDLVRAVRELLDDVRLAA